MAAPANTTELIVDTEGYIDSDSIGLQSMLGTIGLAIKRIYLAIGQPFNGKSTFYFQQMALYDRLGLEVEFIETENGLDKHYAASFFPHRDISRLDALKWYLRLLQVETNKFDARTAAQKKREPLSLDHIEETLGDLLTEKDPTEATHTKTKLYTRMQDYMTTCSHLAHLIELMETKKYPYPENMTVLEDEGMTIQFAEKLIRDATAEFRLQNITFKTDIRSFEQMEEHIRKIFEERIKDSRLSRKPKLIIIDSLNGLFPENDLDKEHSNDGNAFGTAKYLHAWIPKVYQQIRQANVVIGFTCQLTTKIKMSIFEKSDEIADAVFRGGSALKFAATGIFLIERDKNIPERLDTRNGRVCIGSGRIRQIKAKQKGGGTSMSEITKFHLVRDQDKNFTVDYDEPFFVEWLKKAPETQPKAGVFSSGAYTSCLGRAARTSPAWLEAYEGKLKPLSEIKQVPKEIKEMFDEEEPFFMDYTKNMIAIVNNPRVCQSIRDSLGISLNVATKTRPFTMAMDIVDAEEATKKAEAVEA
jgi:RecA/RadA recombinase